GIAWTESQGAKAFADARQAGLTPLTLEEMRQAVKPGSGFLVMDARATSDYDRGHLPGAISAPARDLAQSMALIQAAAGKGDKVLVYCSGVGCHDALTLGLALKRAVLRRCMCFLAGSRSGRRPGWRFKSRVRLAQQSKK